MARLNIEDSLFKDRRFQKLVIRVGDPDLALGLIVRCYCAAQKYWLKFGSIPVDDWKKEGLSEAIIEVGLATVKGRFIYVRGSEEQFKWLNQRSNAGKNNRKRGVVENTHESSERTTSGDERVTNGRRPLSLTLSQRKKETTNKETTLQPYQKNRKAVPSKSSAIWDSYSAAYKTRYKVEPKRNATVNAQAAHLLKRLGESDAVEVVRFYLSHNDRWYVRNGHALGLCLKDAEKLHMEWSSGKKITSATAITTENQDHNKTVIENYLRKSEQLELEREVNEGAVLGPHGDISGDL